MERSYRGPLRDEPIAIELHNTLFAAPGGRRDGLAEPRSAAAFLQDIAPRIGPGVAGPAGARAPLHAPGELAALRTAVRAALQATLAVEAPREEVLEALNAAAARAPVSLRAEPGAAGEPRPVLTPDHHGATTAEVTLAAFAADTISLITGPRRELLRACGAPGCVLMYLEADPRRRWCCNSCGNRARQARHYERTRRGGRS